MRSCSFLTPRSGMTDIKTTCWSSARASRPIRIIFISHQKSGIRALRWLWGSRKLLIPLSKWWADCLHLLRGKLLKPLKSRHLMAVQTQCWSGKLLTHWYKNTRRSSSSRHPLKVNLRPRITLGFQWQNKKRSHKRSRWHYINQLKAYIGIRTTIANVISLHSYTSMTVHITREVPPQQTPRQQHSPKNLKCQIS